MAKHTERQNREEAVKQYYRKHPFCDLGRCYYCGDYISSKSRGDHVPPVSWAFALGYTHLVEKENAPFLIVPCCLDCNCALGNKKYFTLNQRKGYIASWLRERYSKLRKSPIWKHEELEELEGNLAESVKANQDFRLFIERRISWAES